MTIKIYGLPRYTSTGRVLITLFEKNVEDYEIVNIDLSKGDNTTPDYLEQQPFGQIPYVVDGDLTLFETRAISRYIATKFADQGTPLYGSTVKDRALTEQWLEVEGQNYHPHIYSLVINLCFSPKCDDAVVAAGMAKLEVVLDVYEKRLNESKYLAGDFFGLADLSHITFAWFMIYEAQKTTIFDSRPHVKAWFADLFSRPSTQRWLKLAGLAQ